MNFVWTLPKKCLKSEKVKGIFLVNEKSHQMYLRNTEQYVVKHANTERLNMSAIPYMQRLFYADYQHKWLKTISCIVYGLHH